MSIPDEVLKQTIREWLPTIMTWVCESVPFVAAGMYAKACIRIDRKWEEKEPSLQTRVKYALQGFGVGALFGLALWTVTVGMAGKWPVSFKPLDDLLQVWFDAAKATTAGWWMIKATEFVCISGLLLVTARGLKDLIQCFTGKQALPTIKVSR